MRARILLLVVILGISVSAFANTGGNEKKVYKYWVQLKDKDNSPFSIERPNEFLSQKAIERRKRNNIAITIQDLPVNPAYIQQISAIKGVKILNTSRWFNAVSVEVDDDNTMIKFDKLPFVVNSKLMSITKKIETDNDGQNAAIHNLLEHLLVYTADSTEDIKQEDVYGDARSQIAMLNGIKMHQLGFTGKGVTIAVIDGGFFKVNEMEAFREAYAQNQILATWDFVMGNAMVYDDSRHGTGVLSCMLAYKKGAMVGTAPDASYYLLRSEDEQTEYPIEEANWVSAAEYADSAGVDIINSSLGYTEYDDTMFSHNYSKLDGKTTLITRAADIASSKGMVVCNSAGNSGNKRWKYIGAPADANNIITVGAVSITQKRAYFSSFGPTADGRVKPTVSAMGESTIVATPSNKYMPSNGTSYSSPVLCGMVACLMQANPNATSSQIVDVVEKSSDLYPLSDNGVGYGIPDFYLAHILMGNAKGFDYKTNQMAKLLVREVKGKSNVIYTYYSTKSGKVSVKIKKKKKVLYEFDLEVEDGFNYQQLIVDEYINKSGTYTIAIKRALSTEEYEFTINK